MAITKHANCTASWGWVVAYVSVSVTLVVSYRRHGGEVGRGRERAAEM